jgi:ABC-type branched-subunit amino acid transport system permease subunit
LKPLRRKGVGLIPLMIVSIGLSLALRYLFQYFVGGDTKQLPGAGLAKLNFGPIQLSPIDLASMGISIVVLLAVSYFLLRTRIGKATRAVSDNPSLASASGIDVDGVIRIVWVVGGGLAGLSGILWAYFRPGSAGTWASRSSCSSSLRRPSADWARPSARCSGRSSSASSSNCRRSGFLRPEIRRCTCCLDPGAAASAARHPGSQRKNWLEGHPMIDWGAIFSNAAVELISPTTAAYALAALGLAVHFGYTGLLNFGQAGFMALGAYGYAISILSFGFPVWAAVVVGIAASVIFALILGIPTLRLRADYLAIVTIAAAEIVRLLFTTNTFQPLTGSANGLSGYKGGFAALNPIPEEATGSGRSSTTPTTGGCASSPGRSSCLPACSPGRSCAARGAG